MFSIIRNPYGEWSYAKSIAQTIIPSFYEFYGQMALMYVCCMFSHVQLFATPWSVAPRLLHLREFPREEYWSGLPCPAPGDLPDSGIKPGSPAFRVDSLPTELSGKPHLHWGDLTQILFSTRHIQKPPLTHFHPIHLTPIDQVSEILIMHTTV